MRRKAPGNTRSRKGRTLSRKKEESEVAVNSYARATDALSFHPFR